MMRAASVLAALVASSHAQTQTFLSRPQQTTVTLSVFQNSNTSALAPGYIFIAPYNISGDAYTYGPQISDRNGNLIWAGNYTVDVRAVDFQICDYLGDLTTTLCYNDAAQVQIGHSQGSIRFFDNTYTQINEFGAAGSLPPPDIHELNTPTITGGQSLLQDTYKVTSGVNLSALGGPPSGYVLAGCFQDIEITTKKINFQWCSLAHVKLNETYTSYFPKDGSGNSSAQAWDYFHLNSVDRNQEGDYLVSSRGTYTIYKIAGPNSTNPGSIIWRLGGKLSDFDIPAELQFGWPHHARFRATTVNETTISFICNTLSPDVFQGVVMQANNNSMTVEVVESYDQPLGLVSQSDGSLQFLPNGNRLLGWGDQPYLSEHTTGNPGPAIWQAQIGKGYSYRAFKYPWTGMPKTPPDVFAYAQNCTANLVVYMSWNGATRYTHWEVFGAESPSAAGTPIGAASYPRTGYETVANFKPPMFFPYVYVQAFRAGNKVAGTSARQGVFVPDAQLSPSCGALSCPPGTQYLSTQSAASSCQLGSQSSLACVLILRNEAASDWEK